MGQYWIPVNLDKREFVHPHKLASGLKLWEMLAAENVGRALIILTAAEREARGGGDLDLKENWHGPERTFPKHNSAPGPMPSKYQKVASRTIGRWAGDRIAIVGDYAEDSDLAAEHGASGIYGKCHSRGDEGKKPQGAFTDITEDVCAVIEHELQGKFQGDGWRDFITSENTTAV